MAGTAMSGASLTALNSKLYALGSSGVVNYIQEYDPISGISLAKTPPSATGATVTLNGKIFMASSMGVALSGTAAGMYEYDPLRDVPLYLHVKQ
jgi:hypothetical protein